MGGRRRALLLTSILGLRHRREQGEATPSLLCLARREEEGPYCREGEEVQGRCEETRRGEEEVQGREQNDRTSYLSPTASHQDGPGHSREVQGEVQKEMEEERITDDEVEWGGTTEVQKVEEFEGWRPPVAGVVERGGGGEDSGCAHCEDCDMDFTAALLTFSTLSLSLSLDRRGGKSRGHLEGGGRRDHLSPCSSLPSLLLTPTLPQPSLPSTHKPGKIR